MAVAGIPAFLEERHVFTRERANGLYGVESYVVSNFLVSIPFIFIITVSFSGVAYYSMGLQETSEKFCTFASVLFLSLMIAEAQTVFISVAIPVFVAALAVTAFTNGLWMVVQGFFVQKKNIPDFWRYSFHRIDFQKYAYELLISNEMTGLTFSCKDPSTGSCACVVPSSKNATSSCQFTGEDVLKFYDYADIDYTKWLIIMVVIFCVFKIGTIFLLKIQTRSTGQPADEFKSKKKEAWLPALVPSPDHGKQVPKNINDASEVARSIPKIETAPKVQSTPGTQSVPKVQNTPDTQNAPKVQNTPDTKSAPKVQSTPDTKSAPKVQNANIPSTPNPQISPPEEGSKENLV